MSACSWCCYGAVMELVAGAGAVMVLWCYGAMLWCYGVMVLWCYAVMVLLHLNVTVCQHFMSAGPSSSKYLISWSFFCTWDW
jgi:hypothetical protein